MSELLGRRFHRLFSAAGRSVTIAMDHGSTDGVLAGFEDPGKVLEEVIAGGADAILTSIGIARHFSKQLKDVGLLIRCDGATSPLLESPRELTIGIEDVLSSGADAAAAMYIPGTHDRTSTSYFPLLASEAHRWNIPVMAEALPYGFESHPDARNVDAVANACRMSVENGADIVKTFYTGEPESFKKIVRSCFAPVMVLGGPKTHSDKEFLESLRDARDAGAVGVVIGRNVWQSPSPIAMTRALVALFHHDATAEEALQILHPER
ncbi:MAG: fructose-bisphosphate aldolase [Ktedonobacteraceae bacterium]|nr:fructose-bisphosphate aldolase [Ktedonobacteraceae bacterium]